ncbi:hypothetical protein [Reinekea blandensis]|uniref:Uncharacterized protein n=1 Tax=Reinekea blandensis MED297 TaxID=314283 RepID=A4BBT0_9GAMM|nr:hypothetical protein [Reinekea blandensis]EAR10415.1 hypothetical protein MED297_01300 [Reinekea sp. MED297] [Reinekea blandensis MED297]
MNLILLSVGFLLPLALLCAVAFGAERFRNFYARLAFLTLSWVIWMVSGSVLSDYQPSPPLTVLTDVIPGVSNGMALSSQLFLVLLLVSLWRVFPGRPSA